MNPIKIEEALEKDTNFQEGLEEYKQMENKANSVAQEISSSIVESIVKEQDKFNISTALLAVAKSLTHLASYLYDSEEEFLTDVKKARTSVVTDIIPALLVFFFLLINATPYTIMEVNQLVYFHYNT